MDQSVRYSPFLSSHKCCRRERLAFLCGESRAEFMGSKLFKDCLIFIGLYVGFTKAFIDKDLDFTSESTIKVILEILNETSEQCSKELFRSAIFYNNCVLIKTSFLLCRSGGAICSLCNCDWTEPIQLPCLHIFCSSCIKHRSKSETLLSCPICSEKVSRSFDLEKTSHQL